MDTTQIAILAAIIIACIALIFYFEWKARKDHDEMREQDRRRQQRREEDRKKDIERELRKASMVASSPPMRTGASIQRNQGAMSKRVVSQEFEGKTVSVSITDSAPSYPWAITSLDLSRGSLGEPDRPSRYSSADCDSGSSSSSDSSSSSSSCGLGD